MFSRRQVVTRIFLHNLQGDELKWTDYSQYPLSQLVPLLSDALTGLELTELQYILETDKTQKDTIINIVSIA